MSANNGGPAFPVRGGVIFYVPNDISEQVKAEVEKLKDGIDGMALRDYFAAKAMQALIAHEKAALPYESRNLEDFDRRVSYAAYRYADAMLAERAKGGAK